MLTANEIMTDQFVSVGPETTIGKAIERLLDENTSILLVLNSSSQVVGTVSDSIMLRGAIDTHLRQDPISLHMSRQFATVPAQAPVDFVLDQFFLHDLQFLSVVDARESNRLLGVITRNDLLRVVFDHASSNHSGLLGA